MRPVVFGILLELNEADLHGYGLMKAVNERLGVREIVGPGTLYRTLKELRDLELIHHVKAEPGEEDARRQYYGLTAWGRRVARAEATRLEVLVAVAKAGDLLA